MAIDIHKSEVETRDNRLGTLIAYHGPASELQAASAKRQVKEDTRLYSQCSDCSQGCAETLSYMIRDAAIIVHAPLGCLDPVEKYERVDASTKARGLSPHRIQVISTNMGVDATVYGGVKILREAIDEAFKRFDPKAIFIHSSCAAGIIGDDIESVVDEAESELGIPIVPIYCEGFKSKTWASGFDAVFHGVLRKIVRKPEKKQEDLVNIINFAGRDTFSPFLQKLNLRANLVVPNATIEQLAQMSEAACTTHICESLGTYVAAALEEKYDVPQVKAPSPYGIDWTDRWVRELAKVTGRTEFAEKVIEEEHARIIPIVEEYKKQLAGKKAYIYAGDSYSHNLANMVKDYGMEIVGITTLHHDQVTDDKTTELDTLNELIKSVGDVNNFSVCNKQPFIMYKILTQLKPDILITRHNSIATIGTKLGIPSIRANDVNVLSCYDGVVNLGARIIDALQSNKFFKTIAEHVKFPYSSWWISQTDPFYFDKKAVTK
ncbi:MAG: nitrogenase [Treponema sp.]|nr:nitrogenase [Treponema sp.]